MERRQFLQTVGLAGAVGLGLGGGVASAAGIAEFSCLPKAVQLGPDGRPKFLLPPLPYEAKALEPVLSEKLVTIHHDRHHKAYVDALNKTIDSIAAACKAKDTANVRALSDALAFNYGGHVLHTLYFCQLNPGGAKTPTGDLADMITRDFGSFDLLKGWLTAAAVAVQGSGWAVLAWDPLGRQLVVTQTEQHDKLVGWGMMPLLVVDVWEHAYYLDYENKRPDYVAKLLGIVDWATVGQRLSVTMAMTMTQ